MAIKVKYIVIAVILIAFAFFQFLLVRQVNRLSNGVQQQILFTKTYFPQQVSDFVSKFSGSGTPSTQTQLPAQTAPKAPENNG